MVKVASVPPKEPGFLKMAVRRQRARFVPVEHYRPSTIFSAKRLVYHLGLIVEGPNAIDWGKLVPYKGAIYSAINETISTTNSAEPMQRVPVEEIPSLTWGGLSIKLGLSFWAMLGQVNLSNLNIILGVPTDFYHAFAYLSLNAARNVAADLVAKHGRDVTVWWKNADHIKWDKLTDSLLVTSGAYMFLSTLKDILHAHYGGAKIEWLVTPFLITTLDGFINSVTRKYRGFNGKVVYYDWFRPLVGDLAATLCLLVAGSDLKSGFAYLMVRKVFCELWSGHWESAEKRREKIDDRFKDYEKIFDFDAYQVPDPQAMAAVSLVFVVNNKTQAKTALIKKFFPAYLAENKNRERVLSLHWAMLEDERVLAAIKWLLPHEKWVAYREALWRQFIENRNNYLNWLRQEEPLFFALSGEREATKNP
ncbi:MAG: hypothetical protein WCW67_05195 [Candidatus Margulisiibacteriota bacterium]